MSLAHWSSFDREICIVSYSDTIVSMQYLYDILAVLYYNMATVFILDIPPNCNIKKGSYFLTILQYFLNRLNTFSETIAQFLKTLNTNLRRVTVFLDCIRTKNGTMRTILKT